MKHFPDDVQPAVLFQAAPAPAIDGVIKPMKENGYADSGADIAFGLIQQGVKVITAVAEPQIKIDREWVFPDTTAGIAHALSKGANVLWLNTVLYSGHPAEEFMRKGIAVVGQDPTTATRYDDKWLVSGLLGSNGIAVPEKQLITESGSWSAPFEFPFILKPLRGRGSQGVRLIRDDMDLQTTLRNVFEDGLFGNTLYAEPYLPGTELTITVMPPGEYVIFGDQEYKDSHWSMTPVKRFNQVDGIAPYNGVVPIIENSRVISARENDSDEIQEISSACASAAALLEVRAPVRIDCRQDREGIYRIFDFNLKPNMTGPSRPHRFGQDSLVALAAADLGWNYNDLLVNMLRQRWRRG
jgi:D-alanine-D-alanine ligase